MKSKMDFVFKIIIVVILILLANKCYATENNVQEYEISKSEENNFLNNIYQNIYDKEVKEINKQVSPKNYINKDSIETKTLMQNTKEHIYEQFGETKKYDDGEYKGILTIADIKTETIYNGYYEKIDEKVIDFKNYTTNDLNNIPKEVVLNNTTFYLVNVKWEAEETTQIDGEKVPTSYKGSKIYQRVKKINNPLTYKITVKYSGQVEKIDTIYTYKITYQDIKNDNLIIPVIVSGFGIVVLLVLISNRKNTYIYKKDNKGIKIIKKQNLNDKNLIIDITNCRNKSIDSVYAIKINKKAFNKLKGRTISIVSGNKNKHIVLWNNYYEIKLWKDK